MDLTTRVFVVLGTEYEREIMRRLSSVQEKQIIGYFYISETNAKNIL